MMTPHTPRHIVFDEAWCVRTRRPAVGPILAAAAVLIFAAAFLILAPDALAASGNDVGKNLGDFLKQTAAPIYGGIIAIVGLVFLLNRRYSELGMFVLAAIVVGWLVFSPDSVAGTARSIGKQIFG